MAHTHEDREVIVTSDSGTGLGTVVGIILAVVIVLALVWYFGFGGFNDAGQNNQDIIINPPVEPAPPADPMP